MSRRSPSVAVFAVEDRSVQVMWRGLGPGPLRVEAPEAGVAVDLDEVAPVGAAVLDGLPAGRRLVIRASGPALGHASIERSATTLASPPGEELVRIATIGDLHFGTRVFGHRGTIVERPRPEVAHPLRCAQAAADEAVAWGASRMVAKGDLTNVGRIGEWRAYARFVAGLPIPVDAIPGNHDRYDRRFDVDDALAVHHLSIARPLLVRDLPGLRTVLVDTTIPGRNRGRVTPVLDDLLDAAADAPRDGGVLVVLHHQLQAHLLPEGWPIGIDHRESVALLDRLGATHPNVVVTSGHTHRHRRWDHAGVTATQVGSTKDYPGVWAGYAVHEGGLRQVVRRVARPDCIAWTEHSARAAFGAWRYVAPGPLRARCFVKRWRGR